ncbi:MAG: hypothetical protein EBU81_01355 [Proteobacteria bacterium]|nr:hypothetical protein [Pseudomonadota bacterium]
MTPRSPVRRGSRGSSLLVPMNTRPRAITGVECDSVPGAPRGTLQRTWVPVVGLNVAGRLISGEVMFRDQASPN